MNPIILPLIQLVQKTIPHLFNDKAETKFDLSAALNIAMMAALVYFFGFDSAESIVELAGVCQ